MYRADLWCFIFSFCDYSQAIAYKETWTHPNQPNAFYMGGELKRTEPIAQQGRRANSLFAWNANSKYIGNVRRFYKIKLPKINVMKQSVVARLILSHLY